MHTPQDSEDDGLLDTDREKEFFRPDHGGTEQPPQLPSQTQPQPVQRMPDNLLATQDEEIILLPYDNATKVIKRTKALYIRQVTPQGIRETRAVQVELRYGGDGRVIDVENFRRCQATGVVYHGPGAICSRCQREVYPAALMPALMDPQKQVCCQCAERLGV